MKYLASDVRRATFDDLPQLMDLWRMEKLPVEALEKRFTEFQVVADDKGNVVGAIGMQMSEGQGRLHSELFPDYGLADELRPLFWERFKMLGKNHGLSRVWTQLTAPYWQTGDFHDASDEELAMLPSQFATQQQHPWMTVTLREQSAAMETVEKELAMFREMNRASTEKIQKQAKVFKYAALILGILFLGWILWGLISAFRRSGSGPFGG